MANHKSAKKADKQAKVRGVRNHSLLAEARSAVKKVRVQLAGKAKPSAEKITPLLNSAQSTLMRVASKGAMKKKTVSRYISRLSAEVHSRLQ